MKVEQPAALSRRVTTGDDAGHAWLGSKGSHA